MTAHYVHTAGWHGNIESFHVVLGDDLMFDNKKGTHGKDAAWQCRVPKMPPPPICNHCHRISSSKSSSALHTSLSSLRLQQAANRLLGLLQNSNMVLQQLA